MIEPLVAEPVRPWPLLLRGVVTLLLLVVMLRVLALSLPDTKSLQVLGQEWLQGGQLSSLSLFVAAGTLSSAIGLSRQSIALVGGYAFGAVTGTLVTLGAVTLGAALTAEVARRIARPRLEGRFPRLVETLDGWGRERVFARTLAVRLFPVGSNLLINAAAGVAHVDRRAFIGASLLGFVPQTLVFAVAGDGVGAASPAAIGSAIVLLVLSIGIGLAFGRSVQR